MRTVLKISALALAGSVAASAALAAGYSRGEANLNPLFEGPAPSFATSFAYVAPNRGYATINGTDASAFTAPDGTNASNKFTESYITMAGTVAVSPLNNVRCAGSFANPFGAKADFGWSQLVSGIGTKTSSSLESTEIGLTCGYGMDAGPGRFTAFVGGFVQSVEYNEARAFGFDSFATGVQGGDISLSDSSAGFRGGVAYTIPEIAFKAVLSYRSEVDHTVEGNVRNAAFPGGSVTSFADVSTPQSVKLAVQSGIAEGWLAFGSVEWTDWSVVQQVQVYANAGQLGATDVAIAGVTVDAFFNDTYKVNVGVGHKFNDMLSGTLSVTWDQSSSKDQGISDFSDTWTVAAGASFQASESVSIRGGVAYSLLKGTTATSTTGAVTTFEDDSSIAAGLSMVGKF